MMDIIYTTLDISYYDKLAALWKSIDGLGLRSLDDSREGIAKYLARNPATSFIALDGDKLVGCVMSGHDGRRGFIYHTCVLPEYRGKGVGSRLVTLSLEALKSEGIKKVALVAYKTNEVGCGFWSGKGWTLREDLNYFNLSLDENNR